MKKGFHVPLHLAPSTIETLGERLLASGLYQWVELKYPYDTLGSDPEPYHRAVRDLVERHRPGVSVHVPTNYDLGHWSEALRRATIDQIRTVARYAADLGATIMPIHPGTIFTMDVPADTDHPIKKMIAEAGARKKERARRLTVEGLLELALPAEEAGITLALENVLLPQEVVYTAAELESLVAAVGSAAVGALFDCGHAHRCGLDSAAFVRDLAGRIVHVHINDNDGSCDLHMQLGEGTIDYPAFFSALEEVGYHGAVVVETIYRDADDLIESARLIDAYAGGAAGGPPASGK